MGYRSLKCKLQPGCLLTEAGSTFRNKILEQVMWMLFFNDWHIMHVII
uniref:Uncharacterized protein n=1 Tax=Arundo donax TaxID=35708 RepID=A0A0A9GAX5_ARUDO